MKLNKVKLRRIALNQQGLLRVNTFGRGKAAVLRAIEQIGYAQIDTISVVKRAHHHVLWSRVANYKPQFLEQLVAERKVFEYWSHAAAFLPIQDYRFALPRMRAMKEGKGHWGRNKEADLMRNTLKRISDEGPLRARDFEDTRTGKNKWWDWKPAKQALEQLFMQGDLMVSKREGFQKVYDLPKRVLPQDIDTRPPELSEYAEYLVNHSIQAHGFATRKSMSYLRAGTKLRAAISLEVNARVQNGKLVTIALENGATVYADPALLEARLPRTNAVVRVLSPFDNALIQRERGLAVFGFDYKIECYVPARKRQYGYFCLPILYRDRVIGRIDCKAHRQKAQLEIIAQYIERPVDKQFPAALDEALHAFAQFNQCKVII